MGPIAERVFADLISTIGAKIEQTKAARESKQEDANEAEGPMQSRYSTFQEEAQALVDGLAEQLVDLMNGLIILKRIQKEGHNTSKVAVAGSLVTIRTLDAVQTQYYLLVPFGGGDSIPHPEIDDEEIHIVTVASPFGKALVRKCLNDTVEFRTLTDGPWSVCEIV